MYLKQILIVFFDQIKPQINTLIENQLKEKGSAKIIMTLWVVWKKPIKLLIKLPEDAKNAQELDDGTTDDSTKKRLICHLTA